MLAYRYGDEAGGEFHEPPEWAGRLACPEPVEGGLRFAAWQNGPSAATLTVTASAGAIRTTANHRFGNQFRVTAGDETAPPPLGTAAGPF